MIEPTNEQALEAMEKAGRLYDILRELQEQMLRDTGESRSAPPAWADLAPIHQVVWMTMMSDVIAASMASMEGFAQFLTAQSN